MNARSAFRRFAASLAALGIVAWSAGAALAATPDPALPPAWAPDTALTYRWWTNAPPTAIKTAVNAAAGDSNATRRSRAPSFAYNSGAANGVSYGTDNPCGVNGLACFSRDPVHTSWHLWFRENGHRYDWGTLLWCEMSSSPNGCYRAETITLDELGHVAGLDHHVNLADDSDYADAVVQTYSHARPQVGWSASAFGRCDIAALQLLYDVATWTTSYSTCLDVPTTLALAASTTQVVTGTSVTFTATLRSNGTGKLLGNPISNRIVVLQARSGTTWTDLLTMSAGAAAGTYTASYWPTAPQDYRAIFRKPLNEGLRTSSSGAITVSITCNPTRCPLSVAGSGQP